MDDPDAANAAADNSGNSGAVSFFDAGVASGPYPAKLLINYDGTDMRVIEAEVTKRADGHYVINSPVVEGMLWTAVDSDSYMGSERFSLANNNKFLNLDKDNANAVLDDNKERTRWLYETVKLKDNKTLDTMTYRIGEDTYYIEDMSMVDAVTGEGTDAGQKLNFTVTKEADKAKRLVIFQLSTAQAQENNENGLTGLFILTSTPEAIQGLDATPRPTEAPDDEDLPVPVNQGGNSGGNSGTSNTPAPVVNPTQAPEITMSPVNPDPEPASGSDSSGGDTGGDDASSSDA